MKNKSEKKGLFDFRSLTDLLHGNKETQKSSCCGSFELEEIPDASVSVLDGKAPIIEDKKVKKSACCGSFELEEIPDESQGVKDKKAEK